jgi:FixJ family two-component response regulator
MPRRILLAMQKPLVAVVDDDLSVRESLPDLLKVLGLEAQAFASAEAFLASSNIAKVRCLILDIAMPGMSGPELHRELKDRRQPIPVIFVTAQRDDDLRRRMFEEGAVDCLFKPFSEARLIVALTAALKEG